MWGLKKYLAVLGALSLSLLITSCGGNSQSSSTNNNTSGGPSAGSGTSTNGGSNNGGSSGENTPSAVSYAYVGTNGFSAGTINGFAVSADGSASPVAPVNGASGAVTTNNHYLVATDGTNIVSYAIGSGGVLTQASTIDGVAHNDTPMGSAVGTLSLDRTGTSLYAGEINFEGADNGGVAHFEVANDGTLQWVDNVGISSNFGSYLTFSQDNHYAYGHGCYFLTFDVTGFSRSGNGSLTSIVTNALPPAQETDVCPGPSSASPKSDVLVSAMFPEGQQGATDLLITYPIHADGSLGAPSAPAANSGFKMINDVKVDPSGNYVAVSTDAGIQIYTLSSSGGLTPVGAPVANNVTFNNLAWDTSGHLFAISTTTNALYIFNNANGALTQASGSPHAVTTAETLAVASAQ